EENTAAVRSTVADHWSYQAISKPALPAVAEAAWVRTPIDAFILQDLQAAGLTPSADADRATLARRLSLDLLGFIPEPASAPSAGSGLQAGDLPPPGPLGTT